MNEKKRNLAIISPLKPTYSETFIKAHIDLLPCRTFLFYSLPNRGYHPIYNNADKPLFSDALWVNYLETGIERLTTPDLGYALRKKAMRHYLKENKIDAILTEYGPSGTMVMNDAKALNIPLIVHFHGRDAYHYITLKRYGERYKKMFDIASSVIAVSSEMKDQLIKIGCDAAKIHVTPCGPNGDFDLQIDIESNPFQFITTGRFVGKKSPHNTIRAFHKATESNADCQLVMLADGPLWKSSKALAKELNIEDKIQFLGPKTKEDIINLFQESFCFVQHSVRAKDGDSEGTPVSILEAMLAGLPIISTRHAGIKDVVVENETGFLVDEGDWNNMGDCMIKLMQSKITAKEMGQRAKARVLDNFTLTHHLESVWNVIESSFK